MNIVPRALLFTVLLTYASSGVPQTIQNSIQMLSKSAPTPNDVAKSSSLKNIVVSGKYVRDARDGQNDECSGNLQNVNCAIGLNTEISGVIESEDDVDLYRITLTEPGELTVYSESNFDTIGILYAEGATEFLDYIQANNDGGDGRNFALESQLNAGNYIIHIRGHRDGDVGDYELETEFDPTPEDNSLLNVAGIYSGEFSQAGTAPVLVDVLVSPDGEVRVLTELNETLEGDLTLNGDNFSIPELTSFEPLVVDAGIVFGGLFAEGSATGSVSDGLMTGTTVFPTGTTRFEVIRLDIAGTANLHRISGSYTDGFDGTNLNINSDGAISGVDSGGCTYDGEIDIPNSTVGIYDVTLEVRNCSILSDTYDGLGVFFPEGTFEGQTADIILLSVDNDSSSVTTTIIRQ